MPEKKKLNFKESEKKLQVVYSREIHLFYKIYMFRWAAVLPLGRNRNFAGRRDFKHTRPWEFVSDSGFWSRYQPSRVAVMEMNSQTGLYIGHCHSGERFD